MRKGEVIKGYEITQDFSTAGGGLSKWSFARKGAEEFFIKEFLSPTFPTDESPGSPSLKAAKGEKCRIFVKHHEDLNKALSECYGAGGNLIITREFFRQGAKFYKITDKINVTNVEIGHIAGLLLDERLLLLKSVSHSLSVLHNAGVVHGDLKPGNILIFRSKIGLLAAKLIDFDNSFFVGKPPALIDEVVGDMVFYSPELSSYIQGKGKAEELKTTSDIFALGLIFSLYLTGRLPSFDRKEYAYACDAVNGGAKLCIEAGDFPERITNLVNKMLLLNPFDRPNINSVFMELKHYNRPLEHAKEHAKLAGKLATKEGSVAALDAKAAVLKGSLATATSPELKPRLKGTLLGNKDED